jgi:hypothetical protein
MTFQLDIVNRSRFQKGESIMKVTLVNDGGREFDITEHFRVMYDQLIGGMDWGSGFLDGNEALEVMQVGAAAGFEVSIYDQGLPDDQWQPAQPHTGSNHRLWYEELRKNREAWIRENLGDPITWDSISAYRERLCEMEDSDA